MQVDDIVDMVQDEVMQCDIPFVQDAKYSAYRASCALSGLEALGKEYRGLQNKHYALAGHIVQFLKQTTSSSSDPHLKHFRTVVRIFYPNLLVSHPATLRAILLYL